MKISKRATFTVLCLLIACSGCSSLQNYTLKAAPARASIMSGDYGTALSVFPEETARGGNEVLIRMERATILQGQGLFEESSLEFEETASRIREHEDKAVISASRTAAQAGTLLINEQVMPYEGEDFEKIMLHALNAALFFLLLRRWTGRHWMACWGALFWACHPLRVESVAWISGRKDVLSGLFFLLCLWAYGRSADGRKGARGWFWAAAGFFALGLMGKATLMAAPFLLLLLDIWPLRRARPGEPRWFARMVRLAAEKWAFWLLSVLAGALGIWGHAAQNALRPADLGTRLWRIPVHAACYLGQTVWPRSLHVLYADLPLAAGMVAGAILLVAGISAGAWWVRRRRPGVGVGWLWYLAMLLPVAGVVGFGAQSRADRYTYLPAMGLVLMAVQGLPTHGKRRRAWGRGGGAPGRPPSCRP